MQITEKINITNEDCMELLKRTPNKFYDLAICDPPYGIDITNAGWVKSNNNLKTENNWDDCIPKLEYFNELKRVSKNQIIWGGNYFLDYLGNTRCFLIWDKQIGECTSFASSELAWTSFDKSTKTFYEHPAKHGKDKIHPTQKPVKLYEWLLMNYAKDVVCEKCNGKGETKTNVCTECNTLGTRKPKILDTHLGSGSIALACHNLGFDLTACELDKDYYEASLKRLKEHQNQIRIF